MKIGAVFVLFRPSEAQLAAIRGCVSTGRLGAEYVVVDNTPEAAVETRAAFGPHYVFNGNLGGIAGAFNRGVAHLQQQGCDFFFTFDQDSVLGPDFFAVFRRFLADRDAPLVCPDFVDVNSGTSARFTLLNRLSFRFVQASASPREPLAITSAISSGLGFSREVFERVGGFNEAYIIDHVDTDFCFAACRAGYQVQVNRKVVLRHAIGSRQRRSFLFLTMVPSNHPPFRRYYIARNGVDVTRRMLRHYPSALPLEVARMGHELLSVLLFEEQKLRKLKAVLRGWVDGFRGQLGAAPGDL